MYLYSIAGGCVVELVVYCSSTRVSSQSPSYHHSLSVFFYFFYLLLSSSFVGLIIIIIIKYNNNIINNKKEVVVSSFDVKDKIKCLQKVCQWHKRGVKDVFKYIFEDGTYVVSTPDHKFLTINDEMVEIDTIYERNLKLKK